MAAEKHFPYFASMPLMRTGRIPRIGIGGSNRRCIVVVRSRARGFAFIMSLIVVDDPPS
jgi:hypothetical protein